MREWNFRYLEHNVCQVTGKHQTSETFNMFAVNSGSRDRFFYIRSDADSMERDEKYTNISFPSNPWFLLREYSPVTS